MEQINICLIDDHKIVRQGLKGLLERMGSYKVTHEFGGSIQFLQALPLSPDPDLYILDYSMPFKNGIQLLEELKVQDSGMKILLLTQHFEEEIIDQAYYHGARGFLHKNCTAKELKGTIDTILNFGYSNVTDILKRVRSYESKSVNHSHIQLSDRELEFLTLVCQDKEYTYDQIAKIMGVSVKSIEVYRSSIFDRYHVKSKVGLVLFSYKNRLTPPFTNQ